MLDILKEVGEIKKFYESKGQGTLFRLLVYGPKGVGKTSLFKTGRLPVLLDSFDPGGTLVLKDEISEGTIVADTRWEYDDPKSPTVFDAWDKEWQRRKREGFFSVFGTYGLDSFTMLSQVAMNLVLKKKGRPGGIPASGAGDENDYVHQMLYLENALAGLFALPCDIIITAHPDVDKDETTGKLFVGPLITGKAKIRIPLLFDELYYMKAEETKEGTTVYSMLTRKTGTYTASTRLGRGGKLEMYEEPNIKKILRKCGLPADDKPIPWLEERR